MNANGRFRRYLTLLVLPSLTLHWLGFRAFADTPSNAVLIAAMPPGTESVMVQRESMLKGEDSIFRDDYEPAPTVSTSKNIKTLVCEATNRASPIVFAWGASDFQMPPDTGMTGNYNERTVYVVEQSLATVREQLQAGRVVEGLDGRFEVAGVRVYKGTIDKASVYGSTMNSAGEAWFVAFADNHTVVSAESRSDIEYMLKSLKEKRSAIPRRWRAIAVGHNMDSPLVLLRQYPPKEDRRPDMDLFLPPPDTGTSHFALTLPRVSSALTSISIGAKDVDKAMDWYKCHYLQESEYVWNVKRTDAGVRGTLGPKRQGEKPDRMGLVWVVLFGACVMI